MPTNTESLVRTESMKYEGDLSNSNKGDTADLKMVFSKKKIDYSLSYWLLMICLLLIIVGSAVFIFFTKHSGTKCPGDLVYSECHSRCPPQCNNPESGFCTADCVSGCGCSSGLYRNGNKCYKKNDCPKSPGMVSKTSVPY